MFNIIKTLLPKNYYQFSHERFLHDNLKDNNNNSSTNSNNNNKSKSSYHFNLPWCLTKDYKERYQLSNHDLIEIYTKLPTKYLWLAGLLYNIDIPSSSTLISNNDKENLLYRNPYYISNRLSQIVLNSVNKYKQNRLICPYDTFQPNLPVQFITEKQLLNFSKIIDEHNNIHIQSSLWRFKDINILPIYYYHGYILLARVLPKYIYENTYGPIRNVLMAPNEYIINGQVYCETDERFLVTTLELHNYIIQFAQRYKDLFLKYYKDTIFTIDKHNNNLKKMGLQHLSININNTNSIILNNSTTAIINDQIKRRRK